MKKLLALLTGLMIAVGLGLGVTGCGQSTPSISTSNSQPNGLAIKGTIYSLTLADTRGGPLPGAVVAMSGKSTTEVTVTNARGEYLFFGVPDGDYILIVTAEGYQRRSTNWVYMKDDYVVPADNTISAKDIELYSDPIILSFTPQPNSVISQTPTFIISFNEAMDQSTVLPTLVPSGVRTYALSGNSVSLLTSWVDAKTLVITPEAALIANNVYTLNVDPNTKATDLAGFALDNAGEQALELSQTFRVSSGGVPTAPTDLLVTVGTKVLTNDAVVGVDYADVSGGTVGIYWKASTGAVTGYKVYAANSASGNYHLISTATSTTNYVDVTMADILTALYGATTINPVSTGNYPMINMSLYIKVVAYNGDGESAVGAVSARELVGPRLSATSYKSVNWTTDAVLENNVVLPAITDTHVAYIAFREPVDRTSAGTASNYTIAGGVITDATVMTVASSGLTTFAANAYTIVKLTSDVTVTGKLITAGAGVVDLSGNPVMTGVSDTVTP